MTPEKQVQNAIVTFLKTKPGVYIERRNAGGLGYKAGRPDLWFVLDGRHCEVEVKAPGGTAGSLQLKHEDALRLAGAHYWRGDSLAGFTRWFDSVFG